MTRASRKRKVETIILSDSEEEHRGPNLSQSAALRQPLQLSQPTHQFASSRQHACKAGVLHSSTVTESDLLVHKCVPKSSTDLVVQKKKVGEVKSWLLANQGPSLLLLSGPTGCGKTCTVKVLAAELGMSITEWTTPTPTLWAEHMQQRAAGITGSYSSKLDDFEDFVSHAKLGILPLHTSGASLASRSKGHALHQTGSQSSLAGRPNSKSPDDGRPVPSQQTSVKKLLLVEDLPNYADTQQRHRLADLLGSIAGVAKCRVLVTVTVSTAQGGQDRASAAATSQGLHKELLAAMNAAGASHISFNPLTKPNIEKALQQVSADVGFRLPADILTSIAESANGDLRNAVETLQLASAGLPLNLKGAQHGKAKRGKKCKAEASLLESKGNSHLSFGKDTGLALFHALGKILYNKRPQPGEDGDAESTQGDAVQECILPHASHAMQMPSSSKQSEVADRHKRPKLGVDPEAVMLKSGLDSSTAAAFLHENMLEFVHHDAVEDAADACSYLSDAARMMDQGSALQPDWNNDDAFNGQSLIEAAAGSTVLRGLLYSLQHPAARRFLALKSPAMFTNNKAAAFNKEELQALCWSAGSMTGSARVVATDSLPFVRCMTAMPGHQDLYASLPKLWRHIHHGDIISQRTQEQTTAGTFTSDVACGIAAISGLGIADLDVSDDAIESD